MAEHAVVRKLLKNLSAQMVSCGSLGTPSRSQHRFVQKLWLKLEGGLSVYRLLFLSWLVIVTLTPVASAQSWARKMFKITEHDFGTVAKGAKAEFDFEFQNIFEEDVHVSGVRSSCGCTEPHVTKNSLKTWEKGAIRAVFNTRSFIGNRTATLTVLIDKPYYAEVQLSVRGYIRADVQFTPGSVSFGEVEQGNAAERSVSVSYMGRSDWSIVDVRSANAGFEVELLDGERRSGRVTYKMLVRLKADTPAGYLQDQLTIVTNDSYNGSLELPVEGRIVSPLTVSPASLFLGVLKPGETVEKKLFVKGAKPFKIVSIECEGDCFQFQTSDKATAAHLVPLTFTAGTTPGKISQKIKIMTDLGTGATTTCLASATITEPSESEKTTGDHSEPQ
ncbi:MAG: DUF1573 domain-containing protein [Pirellulaceae bacterium]